MKQVQESAKSWPKVEKEASLAPLGVGQGIQQAGMKTRPHKTCQALCQKKAQATSRFTCLNCSSGMRWNEGMRFPISLVFPL